MRFNVESVCILFIQFLLGCKHSSIDQKEKCVLCSLLTLLENIIYFLFWLACIHVFSVLFFSWLFWWNDFFYQYHSGWLKRSALISRHTFKLCNAGWRLKYIYIYIYFLIPLSYCTWQKDCFDKIIHCTIETFLINWLMRNDFFKCVFNIKGI